MIMLIEKKGHELVLREGGLSPNTLQSNGRLAASNGLLVQIKTAPEGAAIDFLTLAYIRSRAPFTASLDHNAKYRTGNPSI